VLRGDGDPRDRTSEPGRRAGSAAVDGFSQDADRDEVDAVDVVDDGGGQHTDPLVGATQPAPALTATAAGVGDVPPSRTAEAVAWWRARHPGMPVREICAKVGRSERTVRRILDGFPPKGEHTAGGPGDAVVSPGDAGGHPRRDVNGATVQPG